MDFTQKDLEQAAAHWGRQARGCGASRDSFQFGEVGKPQTTEHEGHVIDMDAARPIWQAAWDKEDERIRAENPTS